MGLGDHFLAARNRFRQAASFRGELRADCSLCSDQILWRVSDSAATYLLTPPAATCGRLALVSLYTRSGPGGVPDLDQGTLRPRVVLGRRSICAVARTRRSSLAPDQRTGRPQLSRRMRAADIAFFPFSLESPTVDPWGSGCGARRVGGGHALAASLGSRPPTALGVGRGAVRLLCCRWNFRSGAGNRGL